MLSIDGTTAVIQLTTIVQKSCLLDSLILKSGCMQPEVCFKICLIIEEFPTGVACLPMTISPIMLIVAGRSLWSTPLRYEPQCPFAPHVSTASPILPRACDIAQCCVFRRTLQLILGFSSRIASQPP